MGKTMSTQEKTNHDHSSNNDSNNDGGDCDTNIFEWFSEDFQKVFEP